MVTLMISPVLDRWDSRLSYLHAIAEKRRCRLTHTVQGDVTCPLG